MKDPRGHSPNSDALVTVGERISRRQCDLRESLSSAIFCSWFKENGRDLDSMRLFITQWPTASSSARDVRTT